MTVIMNDDNNNRKEGRERSKTGRDSNFADARVDGRSDGRADGRPDSRPDGRADGRVDEQAGGDGVEAKRKSRSRDRESRKRHGDPKSRSHSRDRKRGHRGEYDNGRLEKMELKADIKEEPEDEGLYSNSGLIYDEGQYPNSAFGENSNSSSFDQYQAQNYSQPTYVAYNTKDESP